MAPPAPSLQLPSNRVGGCESDRAKEVSTVVVTHDLLLLLWEATLSNAPSVVPLLLDLFPYLVGILHRSFDHLELFPQEAPLLISKVLQDNYLCILRSNSC